ncbi:MAG: potassium transporter Kup [Bdellovibrionales bacterium]|nr:potassium transporter Kup [Bdellovibrionales bacterium]
MIDEKQHDSSRLWALTLGALGVVFGDIGTSPLYSLRECFSEHYGIPVTTDNVLGILSLIIWSLIIIVSIKYMLFVMRADNKGEGGILSLLALAVPPGKTSGGRKKWLIFLALFGAALLYGDGMITPAITVLSAVEGLSIATPVFTPYVLPVTVVILAAIFYIQSLGTSRIGFVFGPIILLYFAMLAILGLPKIISAPYVLHAFNPMYAITLFEHHGAHVFWALGSVFLAVTGCEALYADMGHFGRLPIRIGWSYVVFPALVMNYLGQGALLIATPEAVSNPFFLLAPDWALIPVVVIATLAACIASQALISGVFSLTRQAISMGFCPRLQIVHTSSQEIGQIYIPSVNWALMLITIWLVLEFRSSSNLVGAYGIAVALTMFITTLMTIIVAHQRWHWRSGRLLILGTAFFVIDAVFVGANLIKIPHGGWFPLVAAGVVFALMTTWKRGRRILAIRLRTQSERFSDFVRHKLPEDVRQVPGTALFMTSDPEMIPPAMARNLKHNHVIHERVVMLSLITRDVPRIQRADRCKVEEYPGNMFRVTCYFGFMETPAIQEVLDAMSLKGLSVHLPDVTFFLGRETLIAARKPGGMAVWREHLFAFMSRNAYRATQFFHIPADQVIEIGSQIEL